MILVDTSVWVDHLRRGNNVLRELLDAGDVCCHPFVIGEIACGVLTRREEILDLLGRLPAAPEIHHAEVLHFVDVNGLAGSGIGWIDAHLLASAVLAHDRVWTMDRALARAAARLGIAIG